MCPTQKLPALFLWQWHLIVEFFPYPFLIRDRRHIVRARDSHRAITQFSPVQCLVSGNEPVEFAKVMGSATVANKNRQASIPLQGRLPRGSLDKELSSSRFWFLRTAPSGIFRSSFGGEIFHIGQQCISRYYQIYVKSMYIKRISFHKQRINMK